jgi:hypothetical protein
MTLSPEDNAGLTQLMPSYITPDGKFYVYSYNRQISELFAVEALDYQLQLKKACDLSGVELGRLTDGVSACAVPRLLIRNQPAFPESPYRPEQAAPESVHLCQRLVPSLHRQR